jgi:hypothetical protein
MGNIQKEKLKESRRTVKNRNIDKKRELWVDEQRDRDKKERTWVDKQRDKKERIEGRLGSDDS